jgi:uncharacterized protein (TIGR03435 family)
MAVDCYTQLESKLELEPSNANMPKGFSGNGDYDMQGQTLAGLVYFLERRFQLPIVDQTGLTKRYDMKFNWNEADFWHPNLVNMQQALLDQLGLELVPTNMPIEMLVVEKGSSIFLNALRSNHFTRRPRIV